SEPSTSARSLMSRSSTLPLTAHGVRPRGANPTSRTRSFAQAVNVLGAVPSTIVGVGAWCLAEQRDEVLHRTHGERTIREVGLGVGHRREHEATTQSRDSP